jgi:dihydropteroate synthase
MGICNVTPDSFSDGGEAFSREDARARVDLLLHEGADIVDIGGESTRPRAPAVPPEEQLARVLDTVRYAVSRAPAYSACVSIDTQDPAVARACLEVGASAVNDVSCLRDEKLADEIVRSDAAYILMHARGSQSEMPGFSDYRGAYADVLDDVTAEWENAAQRAAGRGLARDALLMDPGLGFAKNAAQSLLLLQRIAEIVARVRVAVVVGASRKSFLQLADAGAEPSQRTAASLEAAVFAARHGAKVLRVHDVRATRQALAMNRLLSTASGAEREEVARA